MLSIVGGAILIIGLAAVVLFPEVRRGLTALGRGFAGLFVKNMAKTPEGAKAIYETAILEAEEKYNKAKSAYHRVAGEHDATKTSIENLQNQIASTKSSAESLYRRGMVEDAQVEATHMAELNAELKSKQQLLQNLEPALAQAQNIFELCELNLRKLKSEQKEVVNELQAQSLVKDIMSDLDELGGSSAAQRLINSTNEYLEDLRKENRGAMVVHTSKMSTKLAQADKHVASAEADDFMAAMAAKYGNPNNTGSGTAAASH